MKTKEIYAKPVVEIIDLEAENAIMVGSQTFDLDEGEQDYNGAAYSKRNSFWK